MKPIICFIDDSEFEHDLVRNEIAPFATQFKFVQTFTFVEAMGHLDDCAPALFLLDLWGKDKSITNPYLTTKDEIERSIAHFPDLDSVFVGLDNYEGDVVNEYLKRLFAIVDSWRSLFEEVCDRIGQNRKYGISNLRGVRENYPGVPAVFYTRKSLISDAVAMFKAGADGLFIKPTGFSDQDTRRLTREYAPKLIAALKEFIGARPAK